jgi:hypothetical protein
MSFLHSQIRAPRATNPIFIKQITPHSQYRLCLELDDFGIITQASAVERLKQMGAEIVTNSPGSICIDLDNLAQAAEIAHEWQTKGVYYDFDTEMGNGE